VVLPDRSATSAPVVRFAMDPCQGFVAVEEMVQQAGAAGVGQELRTETDEPAEGMRNPCGPVHDRGSSSSSFCPGGSRASGHHPDKFLGQSITSSSMGSCVTPFTCLVTVSGWDTESSYPSRRIISIRIASCSSPRPRTLKLSVDSWGSTRMATLYRSSFSSRSFRWREVDEFPSLRQRVNC